METGQFFSGSYAPEDITFLLRKTVIELTPVAEKEVWLQSGQRHSYTSLPAR